MALCRVGGGGSVLLRRTGPRCVVSGTPPPRPQRGAVVPTARTVLQWGGGGRCRGGVPTGGGGGWAGGRGLGIGWGLWWRMDGGGRSPGAGDCLMIRGGGYQGLPGDYGGPPPLTPHQIRKWFLNVPRGKKEMYLRGRKMDWDPPPCPPGTH